MKIISNNDIIIVIIIIIKGILTSILRALIKNPVKKVFIKKKKKQLELDINFGEVIGSQGIKCH